MQEKISEVLHTPVVETYDVAVCGGGFGGISAALAAARLGKKTVLFEREFILGGLGTAGLITIYLPICDGLGHQDHLLRKIEKVMDYEWLYKRQ